MMLMVGATSDESEQVSDEQVVELAFAVEMISKFT